MPTLERLLALFEVGLVPADRVVAWADAQILQQAEPVRALLVTAFDGPRACLNEPGLVAAAALPPVDFDTRFAFRALAVDLADPAACVGFARAVAADLGVPPPEADPARGVSPACSLAAGLDDLLNVQHGDALIVETLRRSLPPLLPGCRAVVARWLPDDGPAAA